ncbi:MAG: HEAT repeat domain-containing protein [Acidobacteriota bacterium]|nr:HEAT repeat domain-containing protein [Acidobacteriota bacterium]
MVFSSPAVTGAVLALSIAIVAFTIFLIAYMTARRRWRTRDFQRIDLFRSLLPGAIQAADDSERGYEARLAKLRELLTGLLSTSMALVLLEHASVPGEADAVLRIAQDLCFVESWHRGLGPAPERAGGPRLERRMRLRVPGYAARARSAAFLGRVREHSSWRLLVQALDDPHFDVREAALRSLAAIAEPESIPLIVERMKSTASPDASWMPERAILAAWGQFPIHFGAELLPLLRDSNAGLRRVSADCLIQMLRCGKQRFGSAGLASAGPDVSQVVLTRLSKDEDSEVRARAAILLSYAEGAVSEQTLRRLLEDSAWFVRLHAVRALGARKNPASIQVLAARLTDTNWRVREAAARALSTCGAEGLNLLAETLFITHDRYAREQIMEEIEKSAGLGEVLEQHAESSHSNGVKTMK